MSDEIDQARATLEAAGYVVLRQKSYRQAQERQRVAEARAQCEAEQAESTRVWARNCLDEERRLRERLTFVYGVAKEYGATDSELRGEGRPPCSCRGARWVDDENWQPEDYERGDTRRPGAGRTPCGFCNFGGWDVPDGGQQRVPTSSASTPPPRPETVT